MKKYSIVIIIIILFLPILISLPIFNDGGAYAYMGTLFFDNKLPYIDGWDHKGITLYLINAVGYIIGFKSLMGVRVLEFLLLIFTFLFSYKELSKLFTKKSAFISIFFGLLTFRYFFDGGNLTEEYGALFTMISVVLFLKKEQGFFKYFTIGALFIVNLTIRANLISFWIALFLVFIVQFLLKQKKGKYFLNSFFRMGIGSIFFMFLLSIYFIGTKSFTAFYNAAFTYNFSYAKLSFIQILNSIISSSRLYEVSILMLLALVISFIFILKKKSTTLSLLLFFWIPIELYFSNMSGRIFAHYYMMWVPIIVISINIIIEYFKIFEINKEKQYVILLISCFLFYQIPIFSTIKSYKKLLENKENNSELISNHIKKVYKNKSLLIWGNHISIYNLTNKKATSPYFYQTFFKVESNLTKKIITNFTSEFIQNPPDLLLDARTPSLLFLDESNASIIDTTQKENLKEYFKFVHENYKLKETVKGANFYIKK